MGCAPVLLLGCNSQAATKTMETTNGEIGVGLPLERPSFSKAAFFPSPVHTQPIFFENGKYFFGTDAQLLTHKELNLICEGPHSETILIGGRGGGVPEWSYGKPPEYQHTGIFRIPKSPQNFRNAGVSELCAPQYQHLISSQENQHVRTTDRKLVSS